MELRFDHLPGRQFLALRFVPGPYETVPFIRELRFWGVDRAPCPQLGTLAALIALGRHPVASLTLPDTAITPPVCSALSDHFGVELHPSGYDPERRELAGGDKVVAPVRFPRAGEPCWRIAGAEVLTWISLDDLRGPFGGHIRTNIDAFDLPEREKSLIVALCCAGKDLGRIILDGADPDLGRIIHRIGLELVDVSDAA
ncbi:hypothetical protein HKCCE2091_16660 [Rhodobacterales bacterium HKCCE2091]|nr:hypothetical protein [Rhodobacterales bacterium HKCCE2091]